MAVHRRADMEALASAARHGRGEARAQEGVQSRGVPAGDGGLVSGAGGLASTPMESNVMSRLATASFGVAPLAL